MNETPVPNSDDTYGGSHVVLQEFVVTAHPATPEVELWPRYNMPDYRWMMRQPGDEESQTGESGPSNG